MFTTTYPIFIVKYQVIDLDPTKVYKLSLFLNNERRQSYGLSKCSDSIKLLSNGMVFF